MANYGDVALNLPPDWTRQANLGMDNDFVLMMVGHENGEADAYRKDDPDAEHQFTWINLKNDSDVSRKLSRGYEIVHKDTWTKNPHLWRWDDQGHVVFNGGVLAARPANLYYKDEDRRKADEVSPEKRFNDKMRETAEQGLDEVDVRDSKGVPLRKTARR